MNNRCNIRDIIKDLRRPFQRGCRVDCLSPLSGFWDEVEGGSKDIDQLSGLLPCSLQARRIDANRQSEREHVNVEAAIGSNRLSEGVNNEIQ